MLGGEAVVERQGARAGFTPGLSDHVAMAGQGAGDVAASVQEQHHTAASGRGRMRPLRRHAVRVDRFDDHIRRQQVAGPETIDPRAPGGEVGRSRMRGEAGPDHIDVG